MRECISMEKIPQLMLLTKENVYSTLPENKFHMPAYVQKGETSLQEKIKGECVGGGGGRRKKENKK